MLKLRLLSVSAVVAGLVLAAGALTLSEQRAQAAPEDDIAAAVEAARLAWNDLDVEKFVSYFTDDGLADSFGVTREEALAGLGEEMAASGPISAIVVSDLFVTSGNASAFADIQFEAGFALFEEWDFIFQDGGWKIDGTESAVQPIPEGVPVVDMTLQEYAFNYNPAAIQAADGNFAFDVTNIGQQEHEIILIRNETGMSLLEVLESSDPESEEPPPGIVDIAFAGPIGPGDETAVILPEPLSPGIYGLLCFVSAPDGTPHAFLGMVSEFTVSGGAAPITPPSTGDAGLASGGVTIATWLAFGLALTLAAGGAAGLLRSRGTTAA